MESQLAASLGQPRGSVTTGRPSGPMPEAQSTRRRKGLARSSFAIGAVEHIEEAVAIGVEQQFGGLAFVNGVDQDIGLGGVAILQVVRRELIVPFEIAGFGVESENAVGIEIVAGAVAVVAIGLGIAGGPVERVG